jgi:hypothetical protein
MRIERAIWWLPKDTQTLIVANEPFPATLHSRSDLSCVRFGEFAKSMFGPPNPTLVKEFHLENPIEYVAVASRRFREPEGFGVGTAEEARIVFFKRPLGASTRARIVQADRRIEIHGMPVAMFALADRSTETIYVVQAATDVIITSSDLGFVKEICSRIYGGRNDGRAFPADLPEWRYLDTMSDVWAIRHYDKNDSKEDPTSPLCPNASGAADYDELAVGLVFTFSTQHGNSVHFKYVSGKHDSEVGAAARWNRINRELSPVIRRCGDDALDIKYDLDRISSDRTAVGSFHLFFLRLFGYSVCI